MKKILLLTFAIFNFYSTSAQLNCNSSIAITNDGTITAPAITGVYSNACNANATTNNGGELKGIWYVYQATANGEVTINANLTDNVAPYSENTRISVFTGNCGALQCYDGNDDVDFAASQFLSQITFPVQSGTTYYILWDNYWDANGFDFDFTFTENNCIKPYYINNPTDITSNTAILNWESAVGNPSQYDVEYGLIGFTLGTGTIVATATNSISLTGLTTSETYDYYVRSACGSGSESVWNGPFVLSLTKTLPYFSGFDTPSQLGGWANSGTSSSFGLTTNTANAQSPSKYYLLNSSTTAAVNYWLFSPNFNFVAGQNIAVSFWARTSAVANRNIRLTIGSAQTPENQTAVIYTNNNVNSNPGYTQITTETYTIPTDGTYYFGFNDTTNNGLATSLRFDSFSVTAQPLSVKDFLTTSFDVYPNPTTNIIFVSNEDKILINSINVTDLNGRIITTVQYSGVADIKMNISDLSSGIYFMQINTDNETIVKKIIKE